MKKLLFLVLLTILFTSIPVQAVKLSSLYQADIPVISQTDDERDLAVKQGFLQVLTKVSSDPQIEMNQAIKSSLKRAAYYVQEYSYSAPSTSAAQYILQVRYNPEDINNLLRKAGIAYWGETRPLILVWLAIANKDQVAEIIGNEAPHNVLNTMKQQGKKYGLPLIFPVMDMTDINQISPEDVRAPVLSLLKAAGKRYAPDAFLIGNIQQGEKKFQSDWLLTLGDTQWKWIITDNNVDNILTTIIDQVSQTLAKRYIVNTTNTPMVWLTLEVSNVIKRSDFAQLMQYLKQLAPVQQVQLSEVAGDVVELSILVRGSSATFQQNAAIGQHLLLKSQDQTGNRLVYEWTH